jgi:hypothetical protein
MRTTLSTVNLFAGVVLCLLTGGVSVYILFHADQEARRLLRVKNWARPQDNEDREALRKIKRNMLIGYWGFFVLSVLGLIGYGVALYKRVST